MKRNRKPKSHLPLTQLLDGFLSELRRRVIALPLPRNEIARRIGLHPNTLMGLPSRVPSPQATRKKTQFTPTLGTLFIIARGIDRLEKTAPGHDTGEGGC